jgi:hypothetical protein
MVISGLSMVITGILKLFSPFSDMTFPAHIINSFIFAVLAITHVWLNRKPLLRYFKGLRWWWVLVGLGFVLVIWSVVIVPTLIVTGVF